MVCECVSGERRLRLTAANFGRDYPELLQFDPGFYWDPAPTGDAVDVQLGGDSPWATLADMADFLRTVVGSERLEPLRVHWKPRCGGRELGSPCEEPAVPLMRLLSPSRSPLMDVLTERRIETHFQPIFRGRSLELWGYECLMRGRTPDGRLVSPDEFMDWARRERMFFMLDRVCRETHVTNAARCLPADARVLINFLPTAIYDPRFCLRTTEAAVRKHHMDPSRIIFEVVETDQINDREHLITILNYYRNAGYGVALDDVGAGYSGLTLMAELNPDLIKIDRGLVARANTSPMHRAICGGLAQMARDAGKLCLAEGIETREQMNLMTDLGVDLYQGFLLGKPAPEPAHRPLIAA